MRYVLALLLLMAVTGCSGITENAGNSVMPEGTEAKLEHRTDPFGDRLGTVNFPVSCNSEAALHIERGVALLHHMTYNYADKAFEEAVKADPDCAMGYWGRAMAIIHPLWPDVPDEAGLKRGLQLITRAKETGRTTPRENAYIEAVEAYFKEGAGSTESERLAGFAGGWDKVHEQFPEDIEAAAFYALAHLATFVPEDKTYKVQKEAGAAAEMVLAAVPDHPGGHHYVIHAYDVPTLADRALDAARSYGKIAPEVPHALHMPTHIFTRLGLWDESIEWNIRSADAAWKQGVSDGAVSMHYMHALDYLAYAYLQEAQFGKAEKIRDTAMSLEGPFHSLSLSAAAYALAAIPARYALERHDWKLAAGLKTGMPVSFPWDGRFAPFEAVTHFARAVGAARTGRLDEARKDIDTLSSLEKSVVQTRSDSYWSKQVEVQRMAASAWLQYAEGARADAVKMMRSAAELEESVDKAAVTPGEVLPARELLGDMYMDMGLSEEAMVEYEAVLKRSPNRLNSLYGAGRAAELSGDREKAVSYYRKLADITSNADPGVERLAHARAYLENKL